jgi:hypothetical protein
VRYLTACCRLPVLFVTTIQFGVLRAFAALNFRKQPQARDY